MRTISQCKKLSSSMDMTSKERYAFHEWLDKTARNTMDSYDFCCWLGWYVLDQDIPLSPKEAGFD